MPRYVKKAQYNLDDDVDIPENSGFMVSQDATLSYILRSSKDSAHANYFLRGVFYDMDIRRARTTGSTGGTVVTVFFERADDRFKV